MLRMLHMLQNNQMSYSKQLKVAKPVIWTYSKVTKSLILTVFFNVVYNFLGPANTSG